MAAEPALGRPLSVTELDHPDWQVGQALKPTQVAGSFLCPVRVEPKLEPGKISPYNPI